MTLLNCCPKEANSFEESFYARKKLGDERMCTGFIDNMLNDLIIITSHTPYIQSNTNNCQRSGDCDPHQSSFNTINIANSLHQATPVINPPAPITVPGGGANSVTTYPAPTGNVPVVAPPAIPGQSWCVAVVGEASPPPPPRQVNYSPTGDSGPSPGGEVLSSMNVALLCLLKDDHGPRTAFDPQNPPVHKKETTLIDIGT
ncbi:hypothetical protein Q3G72_019147 [Acer saccharum]|nr:hypothetical protein Q3G72_019147 [Acer saccharum]